MASQEQETAMLDQPLLFDDGFDDATPPGPPSGHYHGGVDFGENTVAAELEGMRIRPGKGKSLRDIGRSNVQETMRREMTDIKKIEAELLQKQIPEAAKAIIDEYSLRLDRATWVIVQEMVESGIRAGLAIRAAR